VFFEGPIFAIAYLVVVLISAPLLAAGVIELLLGLYAVFSPAKDNERISGKPHFVVGFATFVCFGAYCVFSVIPK
jgi:hypothetical protein